MRSCVPIAFVQRGFTERDAFEERTLCVGRGLVYKESSKALPVWNVLNKSGGSYSDPSLFHPSPFGPEFNDIFMFPLMLLCRSHYVLVC
jgi:hypothetical protein